MLSKSFRAAALALLAAPALCLADVTLTQDGQPKATIVVAKAAVAPAEKDAANLKIAAAAKDLQAYVEKISGAKLPIVGDDAQPAAGALVLVGKSKLTEPFDAHIPFGLTPDRKEEGLLILAKGGRLVLAGNDAGPYHGTEYAVARFLRDQGVRWFMPGEFGESVLKQPTLTVKDSQRVEKPDFSMRNWWAHGTPEMQVEVARWKIRNGMNPEAILAMPGDSSVRSYCAEPELTDEAKAAEARAKAAAKPGEAVPEHAYSPNELKNADLFARNADGTVNIHLPSMTNPAAVKVAAEKMKAILRKDPADSIGIAPDDGIPRDFSPEAAKLNQGFVDLVGREGVAAEFSISEEWFAFVNAVTAEVKKEFPKVIVTTNGYANRNTPPRGITLDPNLGIMFAAIWSDTMHAYDDPKSWQTVTQGQMLREWARLNPRVFMYNYLYEMLASGLSPIPVTRKLARNFPLMKKWGVIGFSDEARAVWMETGIASMYTRAHLEWKADTDVKALLDDYYARWYGPAAKPARAFWDHLEDAIEGTRMLGHEDRVMPFVYSPELVAKLKQDLEEAEKLASDETSKKHVKIDRLTLDHMQGYMAMQEAEFAADFPEAIRQIDRMLNARKQLSELSIYLCRPNEEGYASGIYYWGIVARRDYYQKLADRLNGKAGDKVAILPREAAFTIDPYDKGRFEEWYKPEWDAKSWQTVSTTRPFYLNDGLMDKEGHPYLGYMWYRLETDVATPPAGQPVKLYAPVVETEAWVWVNGQYIGYRPYHEAYERPNELDMDVTKALQPGKKNVIVLRVNTGLNRAGAPDGLLSRLFLYSAKPEPPKSAAK